MGKTSQDKKDGWNAMRTGPARLPPWNEENRTNAVAIIYGHNGGYLRQCLVWSVRSFRQELWQLKTGLDGRLAADLYYSHAEVDYGQVCELSVDFTTERAWQW